MKNAIKKFFSFILAIFIVIIFGVCLIFMLPFDYIKYKKSLYYKNTKRKYVPFVGTNHKFKIYNEISKNNLPISFIHHPKENSILYGQFVFEKTLIIVDVFDWVYDPEEEKWLVLIGHDEEKRSLLSIDEYIETEIEECNQAFEEKICDKAVILIREDELENAGNAYKEERFLIYKDDIIEKLKLFIEKENNALT